MVLIDTAGIDDEGELGRMRVEKSMAALAEVDLALLLYTEGCYGEPEERVERWCTEHGTPMLKVLTKAGVKKDRIKAIGMGSSCPVDDNSTAEGREMNRRIEMHFVTPDNDGTQCESNLVQ